MPAFIALAEQIVSAQTAVVPVVVSPIQILLTVLPGLLAALGGVLLVALKPKSVWLGIRLAVRFWYATLPVAGLVWLVVWGWGRIEFGGGGAAGARSASGTWAMARGGADRNGWAGGEAPNRPGLAWQTADDRIRLLSSPAVVGNRVYASTAVYTPTANRGEIVCFDADTGAVVWRHVPAGFRATFSSPTLAGDRLLVGEGLHFTNDARVFCLDIADERRVKALWSFSTRNHVESTPAVATLRDGAKVVVVGAGSDGYHGLDLDGDGTGGPRLRWRVDPAVVPDAESSPAIATLADGRVVAVVGSGNEGNAVVAIDCADGTVVWKTPVPYPVFAAPTVVDGLVVVGMGNGDFINNAETVRAKVIDAMRKRGDATAEIDAAFKRLAPGGAVAAFGLEDGKERWTCPTPVAVLGAAAVQRDAHGTAVRLFAADTNGTLVQIDMQGRRGETWNPGAPIMASPAVAGGRVYMTTSTGVLYALDAEDLAPRWEHALGAAQGMFFSAPVVAGGRIYAGGELTGLQAVGTYDPTPPVALARGGRGSPGGGDGSALPAAGAFRWNWPDGQTADSADGLRITASPAVAGGDLLVPVAAGARTGLACLPFDARAEAAPRERWFAAIGPVRASPALIGDAAFAIAGSGTGAALHRLARTDGRTTIRIPALEGAVIATVSDLLAALPGATVPALALLDPATLATRWTAPLPGSRLLGAEILGTTVFAVGPQGVVACARRDGAILWQTALAVTGAPMLAGNLLLVPTADGVVALRVGGGEVAAPAEGGLRQFAGDGRTAAWIDGAGRLRQAALPGLQLRAVSPGLADLAPVVARGRVLAADATHLLLWNAGDPLAEPVRWAETAWLGAPSAAPILAQGVLLLPTTGYGLVAFGAAP